MKGVDPERLAAKNLWRCRVIAYRMTRGAPWEEDEARSAALVGLAEAIRTYSDSREAGGGFAPYARRLIVRAVSKHLLDRGPRGYRRCRDEAPIVIQGYAEALDHPVEDVPAVGWECEWEDFVHALCRRLPGRKAEVIRLRYTRADGQSIGGMMARMGVSDARINLLHRQALAMLRESYGRATG